MDQHRQDVGPGGLRGAALGRVGGTAVDAVLRRVEVAVGELGHVVVERAEDNVEAVALVRARHGVVDLAHVRERDAVVRREALNGNALGGRVKLVLDLAEQEAEGVADLAVRVTHVVEDRVVAGDVGRGVDRGNPQAQHVGAAGVALLVGVDHVAERLGHLAALAVQREALRDDRLVGGHVIGANRGHERAHEPAAVLVGALEVHVGGELEVAAVLAHGGVRDARVPPHIKDVSVRLEVVAAALGAHAGVAQVARRVVGEPGVGALLAEELDDLVERGIVHDRFAAVLAGIGRDGHTPVALARDAPVRPALDHRGDAVAGVRGVELDLLELAQGVLAQAGLVHRDEPLAGGAEDDRLLAAPAVRVAVGDVLMQDERAALLEPLDDLGVGVVHVHAGPRAAGPHAVALVEVAVVVDGHDHGNVEAHARVVVVHAMAGSRVDDAGAILKRDVVGVDELALDALVAKDGLLVLVVAELLARHAPDLAVGTARKLEGLVAKLGAVLLDEGLGHDLGAAVDDNGHVVCLGVQDDRVVGGKGPRGRGPDVHPEVVLIGLEADRHGGHLEAHEDGRGDLVAILDLGLGERRVAVGAPVHGLAAAINRALVEDGLEDLDVGGVVVVDVGEVGVVPLAQHAQALEALALGVDLLDRHLAAELADLDGGELVELLGAQHLLDLVLDGLAVAVPAGHIRRLVATHGPVAIDDVLADLILSVTQVDGAVGVRGAIMKHELLVPLVLLEELLVELVLLPLGEALGLVLRERRPHWKPRLGEVHRLLVLVCHLDNLHLAGTKERPSLLLGRSARFTLRL